MSSAVINLVTGINGSGKTLFLLQEVERLRKETNRPVYYWGIRGLKEAGVLPWTEISPMDADGLVLEMPDRGKIHELPEGAIIVIDEAHAVFAKTGAKETPNDIGAFATSRWRGHTFFLCTQAGGDIHTFVRKRVGKHHHLKRAWGLESATRFEWEQYSDVSSTTALKQAQAHKFPFPKEVYGWYKSSDSHQVKKSIPWKKLSMFAWAPILIAALGWWVWHRLGGDAKPAKPVAEQQSPEQQSRARKQSVQGNAQSWAARFEERVPGLPYSAPIYDEALKPVSMPKISGCMEVVSPTLARCTCNTQQGTRITTMSYQQCKFYLANGWFDPTLPDERTAAAAKTDLKPADALPSIAPQPAPVEPISADAAT